MVTREDVAAALWSREFSGVVRVVHRGECLLQHSAGCLRSGAVEPIGADTRFAAASMSKMFTALCLARLAEAGECDLDRPIADYTAEAACFGEEVTLNSLLSHRSGLGDYIDDDARLPFSALPVEKLTHVSAFLPFVLRAPRHTPGVFRYSSAGFVLLGSAIEAITGQPYPQAVRDGVLDPAKLVSTGFDRLDDATPDFAWGYLENGEVNHGHLPPVGGPDGGVVTTVGDLERLASWMKSDEAFGDTTRENLWRQTSGAGEGEGYAHGFDVMKIAGQTWVGHTGSDPGVSARGVFAKQSESSIVVLCNRDSIAFRVFRLIRHWIDKEGWPKAPIDVEDLPGEMAPE